MHLTLSSLALNDNGSHDFDNTQLSKRNRPSDAGKIISLRWSAIVSRCLQQQV
jgi:hypothetical protein